jgi:hypothetical protein
MKSSLLESWGEDHNLTATITISAAIAINMMSFNKQFSISRNQTNQGVAMGHSTIFEQE